MAIFVSYDTRRDFPKAVCGSLIGYLSVKSSITDLILHRFFQLFKIIFTLGA
jgi:hypothetical protein